MFTMRCMPKRSVIALAVAGFVAIVPTAPVGAAEVESTEVVGGWVGELPCPFTSAKPSAATQTVVAFDCASGTIWDGSWVGHTLYKATGTVELLTGDLHGTLDETLVGAPAGSGATGTLHLTGTVDIDGRTSTAVVRERIVGGTGAFEGSSGDVVFEGTQLGPVTGHGGYHGTWRHP